MNESIFSVTKTLMAVTQESDSAEDILIMGGLGLLVLFFLWLVVAVIRKKLSNVSGRLGDLQENEAEAARTARLWSEAKRKTDLDEDDEEEVEAEPQVDLQEELHQKAQRRREEEKVADLATQKARQQALRASQEKSKTEPAPAAVTTTSKIPQPVEPEPEPKSLSDGLKKTRTGFVKRLAGLFSTELDEDQIEEIEAILFTADIGVRAAQKLVKFIQNEIDSKRHKDTNSALAALKDKIHSILDIKTKPLDLDQHQPTVILVVGVNGTGKTTTIGKLALRFKDQGKKVLLAAADTFRAAAAEQLEIWSERSEAVFVRGQEGGDPGAVVFDAINAAKNKKADVVIVDTAGRLHTKANLVEELRKIHRVCGKAHEGAPHEVWLVLDATTGQNAINQAKEFHQALELSGMILTKLDGTAKGGVIIGITDSFGIPVRYIGIGEQACDLRPFDPSAFVEALFS